MPLASLCWRSIGSYAPRGTARASWPAQLSRALRTTQPEHGTNNSRTSVAFTPAASPSSRETPSLPGEPGAAGTRACPPFFAFSESFHSLFPGSSSCDFPSCCQTSPWQPLPPSFLFIPMDYGGAGTSGSTEELWADPALAGDPMRAPDPSRGHRGIITHVPPQGPRVSPGTACGRARSRGRLCLPKLIKNRCSIALIMLIN